MCTHFSACVCVNLRRFPLIIQSTLSLIALSSTEYAALTACLKCVFFFQVCKMDLDECMRKHSIVGDQSDAENEKESGKKLRQGLFRETAKHFFVPQSSNTK